MIQATIYVTDDEQAIRSVIARRLSRRHHHVRTFDSGEALLEALTQEVPDLVVLDLKMGGMTGLETLKILRAQFPQLVVIMLTAYGTVEDAVEAMKLGAQDFVIKTVELENFDPVLNRTLELLSLRRRVLLASEKEGSPYALSHMTAQSASMQQLMEQIRELTQNSKTTVLLVGETGTGKEFLSRILHHNGPRAKGPFIGVNCTAIPSGLFESELFGYERGAFTGANQRKLGLLEQADGGTLFLDEIGDLDLTMQAKLLRVLQERVFRRLGGTEDIPVDFRLIAATNRDLKKAVEQGNFREDLFFRLNVIMLEIPPLRMRVTDIVPLAMNALIRYSKEMGKEILEIDPEARHLLEKYAYPGNIRELQNLIERAVIFCHGRTLTPGDLPQELRGEHPSTIQTISSDAQEKIRIELTLGEQSLADIESALIDQVLHLVGHNKSAAAKYLGLSRFALDRRLKRTPEG